MDFASSDLFNPMLVRDLRQGLRSSRFTLVFLTLQICMAFFVTMGLLSGQGTEVGRSLTHSLMIAFILFYILGLPMAATFAFWSEFSENRIDLLKLTQMSARSLVWGKWFSLFLQGLMVFFSMLPYLMLTYFFPQVDLAREMLEFSVMLGLSALLMGCGVVISCFRSAVFQVLVILGLLWLAYTCLGAMSELERSGYAINNQSGSVPIRLLFFIWQNPGMVTALYITICLPALWLVMEYGAARLAPISENHDTPQRLVLLAIISFAGLIMVMNMSYAGTFIDDFTDIYLSLATLIGGAVLMFAASAEPSPYPDTYRPFVRFGFLGKVIGRAFLYPGWPSSTPFVLLVTAFYSMLATAWYSLRAMPFPDGWAIPYLLLPSAILFPQLVGWFVLGRTRLGPGGRYFTVLVFCVMIYVACASLYGATHNNAFIIIAGILPPDAWMLFASGRMSAEVVSLSLLITLKIISASIGGLTLALMCLRSLWHWKKTQFLEKRASDSLRVRRMRRPGPPVVGDKPPGA